jgi:thiol-disulfide isomerase/thioredoxin
LVWEKYLRMLKKFKEKSISWWIYTILAAVLIVIFIVPSFRVNVSSFINGLITRSPKSSLIEKPEEKIPELIVVDANRVQKNIIPSQSNKLIIINNWASWCGPCRAEMPSFSKLYESYSEKVDFYFIANERINAAMNYLYRSNLKLPVYFKTEQYKDHPVFTMSNSIPTTYIIDKNNELIWSHVGSADFNTEDFRSQLDQMIEQNNQDK